VTVTFLFIFSEGTKSFKKSAVIMQSCMDMVLLRLLIMLLLLPWYSAKEVHRIKDNLCKNDLLILYGERK